MFKNSYSFYEMELVEDHDNPLVKDEPLHRSNDDKKLWMSDVGEKQLKKLTDKSRAADCEPKSKLIETKINHRGVESIFK